MKRKPPRDLTREERALWDYITRDVEKLNENVEQEEAVPFAPLPPKQLIIAKLSSEPKSRPPVPRTPRNKGEFAGVDAATARKVKRGKKTIDATLDLHGYGREEAYFALKAALTKAQERGYRLLLVITGKGGRGGKEGVLQLAVPRWLGEAEFAQYVLAFDTARPEHGGAGALYVLVRRRR